MRRWWRTWHKEAQDALILCSVGFFGAALVIGLYLWRTS
jgi:hypothetical protein